MTLKMLDTVEPPEADQLPARRLFIFEAIIMMELQHPNILSMIGVCTKESPWIMVNEYLECVILFSHDQRPA